MRAQRKRETREGEVVYVEGADVQKELDGPDNTKREEDLVEFFNESFDWH